MQWRQRPVTLCAVRLTIDIQDDVAPDRVHLRYRRAAFLVDSVAVTASGSGGVDVVLLSIQEAARVAAATPGPTDVWAEGFPRGEDRAPASRVLPAGEGTGPFGVYRLVERASGATVGTAGFFGPPDGSRAVTIGYGMVEQARGRGYATAAMAALVSVCRAAGGVDVVKADTEVDNFASRRVLEKNGFSQVGRSGSLLLYELRLATDGTRPGAPAGRSET